MSYLRFEKALMTNLQESLPREVLRTNRSGAYACSTIVDCNTRKYHGLLVVPIPELDDDNHVLLSSFDPSVIQHGVEFQLGLHKYKGEAFSPNGHKYIREFDCEKVPTTLYRVGGVKLRKELVFQHYDDRVLIRYTLVDAHSETKLRFRPFLAFRSVKQFTHENPTASREYEEIENGIRTRMYAGYPYLYMQFSKKPTFVFHPTGIATWNIPRSRSADTPRERTSTCRATSNCPSRRERASSLPHRPRKAIPPPSHPSSRRSARSAYRETTSYIASTTPHTSFSTARRKARTISWRDTRGSNAADATPLSPCPD